MQPWLLVALLAAGLLSGSCLGQGERLSWHSPTGVSTLPAAAGASAGAPSFDQYVAATTASLDEALRKGRPSLSPGERARLVGMRAPFAWPPDPPEWVPPPRCASGSVAARRAGILLIHGLTDTPYLMRDVGRHFRERHCFTVRAILLPGHGTVPGDLLEVTYPEWIAAARYGIDSFAGAVDDLYIAGFSTGGTLALYHALAAPAPGAPVIRGLILFSPAIEVADVLAPLANWHRLYSWAVPRGEWIGKLFDEHDDVKYESFAKNGGDQIYLLTHEVAAAARGRRLPTPLFIALSQDDATVSSRATIEFFRQVTPATGSPNALIAYTTVPEAIGGRGPIRDRISVYPDQGIIAFSHVSIPVRPDNPHYGRNGSYRSCLEYEKADNERAADLQACLVWREGRRTGAGASADHPWCRCREGEVPADGVRLGETSAAALHALEAASTLKGLDPPLVLRRLTFNPDFDGMMAEVDAFLDRIQRQPR